MSENMWRTRGVPLRVFVPIALLFLCLIASLFGIIEGNYILFDSLISLVKENKVSSGDIAEIAFLAVPKDKDWPKTKQEYSGLKRVDIKVNQVEAKQLIGSLKKINRDRVNANHPATVSREILFVKLRDGREFYLHITVLRSGPNFYYLSCYALASGATSPAMAQNYESADPTVLSYLRDKSPHIDSDLKWDKLSVPTK